MPFCFETALQYSDIPQDDMAYFLAGSFLFLAVVKTIALSAPGGGGGMLPLTVVPTSYHGRTMFASVAPL